MARATRVAGRLDESQRWRRRAEAELPGIAGAEDRAIIERDLATLP